MRYKQRQVGEKCHPTGLCSFAAFGWRVSLCCTEQEDMRLCSPGWTWKGRPGSRKNPTVLAPAPLQCYDDQDQRSPQPKSTILKSAALPCSLSPVTRNYCPAHTPTELIWTAIYTFHCHSPFWKQNLKGSNVLSWTGHFFTLEYFFKLKLSARMEHIRRHTSIVNETEKNHWT